MNDLADIRRRRALRRLNAERVARLAPPSLPEIRISEDQRAATDEAERALLIAGRVYVRARALVHVVRDRSSDWLRRPDGSPVITVLRKERLRELLGEVATWCERDGRATQCPAWVVETLLARDEWTLPEIEGIADAPTLRPDGSILDVPGYDPMSRLIYDPCGVDYPAIPSAPTRDDARAAMAALLDPFGEFPFVAASDRAAVAAMILSIIARPAIDGVVPMFLATAPTPGSGKGLLVDACSVIATGRAAPKMAPTDSDEETRKRLLAIAVESPPIVAIDNVEGTLGGAALAMAITAGEVRDRVLGATKIVTATLRPVWAATGNNVTLKGDLGRRVVPIGLDPGVEHPEDRAFARRDLLAYVRAERPRLVVAALTVLRAYVAAGRPAHGAPAKGSFEAWDHLVRGAIMWAGEADPLGGVERIREAGDSDLDALRTLLSTWHAAFGTEPQVLSDVVRRAAGLPDLGAALAAYTPKGLDATPLGYALKRIKDRIAGGMRLTSGGKSKRGVSWRVEVVG